MNACASKPVVLLPACNQAIGAHPFHVAGKKYVDFVRLAGCLPLIVPNASADEYAALLALADGLLLTGSPSNVHPCNFGEPVHDEALPLDTARDAWTLPFIRQALLRGMPLFGICRGAQETNVALGGSLYQAVQEVDTLADHRAPPGAPAETQYGPAHAVQVVQGGLLQCIVEQSRFEVNSLHGQGVKRLADGLRVEALAPDGLVEAFSKPDAPGFNLCVQWHPEWHAADNVQSRALALAFGDACRAFQHQRLARNHTA